MTAAQELAPCPFCEGKHIRPFRPSFGGTSMMCSKCCAEGPHCDTDDQAIEAWNRRPQPSPDVAQVMDELRGALEYEPGEGFDDMWRAIDSALKLLSSLRAPAQGEWIPWKPGDPLPPDANYWVTWELTASQRTAQQPAGTLDVTDSRPDCFDVFGVLAYWSVPVNQPPKTYKPASHNGS